MPPELLGPTGLVVAALIAAGALWREHLKQDADVRAQRDRALGIAERIVEDSEARGRRADD